MLTFDHPTPLTLVVDTDHADIAVLVSAGAATVRANDHEGDADHRIAVELAGDVLHVRTLPSPRHGLFWRTSSLDLAITVPPGSNLDVTTRSGDVRVDGTVVDARIHVGSGDAQLGEVTGTLSLVSGSGDAVVSSAAGEADLRTGSGDVTIGRAGGRLRVEGRSGDVHVYEVVGAADLRATSGDVEVVHAAGDVRASTGSGDVMVGVIRGASIELDARSGSGDVRNGLLDAAGSGDGQPPTAHLALSLRTGSGDVVIRRAAAALVP